MSKMSTEALTSETLQRRAINGPTMGSRWSAIFYTAARFDTAPLCTALQKAVDRVDRQMSTWKPDSDLNRLNEASVGVWVDIPRELMTVIATALEIGRASGGSFNIGVGDLVRAWGFAGGSPDPTKIARLRGRASFEPPKTQQLDLSNQRVRKHVSLCLDLSGIAKGFGVDELGRVMDESGLVSWLVGIDGEMCARGEKPGARPWTIAHEKTGPCTREVAGVLEVADCAVATSGNYRHVAEIDGERVSHTMDPRTGTPVINDLAAVTVLADTCMKADAWATAMMVSGALRGLELSRKVGLPVVLVRTDGQTLSTL
jgi:FAD:protein FMN transferase